MTEMQVSTETKNNAEVFPGPYGIVMLHTGQGQQHGGEMGMFDGFDDHPATRQLLDDATELLGYDLRRLTHEQLQENLYMQTANVVAAIGGRTMYDTFRLPRPNVIGGHSLGAMAALNSAGVLSRNQTIGLSVERTKATNHAIREVGKLGIKGAMATVLNLDLEKIREICSEVSEKTSTFVHAANINSATQVVISGRDTAVEAVRERIQKLRSEGGRRVISIPASIDGAFHSMYMELATTPFAAATEAREFRKPYRGVKVLSTITGNYLDTQDQPDSPRSDIVNALTKEVRYDKALATLARTIAASGLLRVVFIECGPFAKAGATTDHGVLTGLHRRKFQRSMLTNRDGGHVDMYYLRLSKPEDATPGTHAQIVLSGLAAELAA